MTDLEECIVFGKGRRGNEKDVNGRVRTGDLLRVRQT